jgi:hypothetical protein
MPDVAVVIDGDAADVHANLARQSMGTNPSYATAHENLGDIYAKMAREAYDKALQLDSSNSTARAKLALVRELFSQKPGLAQPLVKSGVGEPVRRARAAEHDGARDQHAPRRGHRGRTPPAPAKPVVAAEAGASGKAKDAPDPQNDVVRALNAWARAWSSGDAKGYLSFYAPSFKVPGGQNRSTWEHARRERIAKGRKINVQIQNPKVTFAQTGRSCRDLPPELPFRFAQDQRDEAHDPRPRERPLAHPAGRHRSMTRGAHHTRGSNHVWSGSLAVVAAVAPWPPA